MSVFQTAGDFQSYLNQFTNYEKTADARGVEMGLGRVSRLLNRLGDPQRDLKVVHVAGTKGKGSTCLFLDALLRATGFETGLYTSPHVYDLRERIQVNAEWISEAEWLARANEVHAACEAGRAEGRAPTFFDVVTAMAFLHFRRSGVDYAVVETGLGGRLDSTNVVEPLCSVITGIGYDHMDKLGDTLESIAREKGGIIKGGVPVVLGKMPDAARNVLREIAREKNVLVSEYGGDFHFENHCYVSARTKIEGLTPGVPGKHQECNLAVALRALEMVFSPARLMKFQGAIRSACADLVLPGRIQVLPGAPTVIVDGAHNEDSFRALAETLAEKFSGRKMTLVFSLMKDKDLGRALQILLPAADRLIATTAGTARNHAPEEIAEAARRIRPGIVADVAPTVEAACDLARRVASGDGLICATGSFYAVAPALSCFVKVDGRTQS